MKIACDQEKEMKASRDDVSNTSHDDDDDHHHHDHRKNKEHSKTTQFYNCTYCKRGFTTAQALGGHMNIHRKDRAKTQMSTSSSGETTLQRPPAHGLSLFLDDHDKLSLDKRLTSSSDRDRNTKDDEAKEELDLTLRLGHEM